MFQSSASKEELEMRAAEVRCEQEVQKEVEEEVREWEVAEISTDLKAFHPRAVEQTKSKCLAHILVLHQRYFYAKQDQFVRVIVVPTFERVPELSHRICLIFTFYTQNQVTSIMTGMDRDNFSDVIQTTLKLLKNRYNFFGFKSNFE